MSDDLMFSAEMMGELLQRAIDDHGFKTPIRLASVGSNNSTIVGVYTPAENGGLDFRIIAEHVEDDLFVLPVNIMLADRTGQALHVKLQKGQKKLKLRVVH